MTFSAVLVNGAVGDDEKPIGMGAIVTYDADSMEQVCKWIGEMTGSNEHWRIALVVPADRLDKTMAAFRVDPSSILPLALRAKLGSLVAHVNELDVTSKTAEVDVAAAKTLVADVEVSDWLSTIDPALLPAPRDTP